MAIISKLSNGLPILFLNDIPSDQPVSNEDHDGDSEEYEGFEDVSIGIYIGTGYLNAPENSLLSYATFAALYSQHLHELYDDEEDQLYLEIVRVSQPNYVLFSVDVDSDDVLEAVDEISAMVGMSNFDLIGDRIEELKDSLTDRIFENSDDKRFNIIYDYLSKINPYIPDARSELGDLQSISELTAQSLEDYYSNHYHAGNMCIVITGNVNIEHVSSILERNLFHLEYKERQLVSPNIYKSDLVTDWERSDVLSFVFNFPAKNVSVDDSASFFLLQNILGDDENGLLTRTINKNCKSNYLISSFYDTFENEGVLRITGDIKPEDAQPVFSSIREVFNMLVNADYEGSITDVIKNDLNDDYPLIMTLPFLDPRVTHAMAYLQDKRILPDGASLDRLTSKGDSEVRDLVKRLSYDQLAAYIKGDDFYVPSYDILKRNLTP
jgi:hypothetical protein